jgi:hypothetical protein
MDYKELITIVEVRGMPTFCTIKVPSPWKPPSTCITFVGGTDKTP